MHSGNRPQKAYPGRRAGGPEQEPTFPGISCLDSDTGSSVRTSAFLSRQRLPRLLVLAIGCVCLVVLATGCSSKIATIRDTDEISKLRDYLEHDKSWVREEAARKLGELKSSHATEALIARLDDRAPWVRQAAAHALGKIRDQRAVDPLVARLRNEDKIDVQSAIILSLAALDNRRALNVLRKKRRSDNLLIKGCAQYAVKELKN